MKGAPPVYMSVSLVLPLEVKTLPLWSKCSDPQQCIALERTCPSSSFLQHP